MNNHGIIVSFLTSVFILIFVAVLLVISIIVVVFAHESNIKYSANLVTGQTAPYDFLEVLLKQPVNDKTFAEAAAMYTAVGYGKRFEDFGEMRQAVKDLTKKYGIGEYNLEMEKDESIIFRVMKVPEFCGNPRTNVGYCKSECSDGQKECKKGDDDCPTYNCNADDKCCLEEYEGAEYKNIDDDQRCGVRNEGICDEGVCDEGRKQIENGDNKCIYQGYSATSFNPITGSPIKQDVEGVCCAPMKYDEILGIGTGDSGTAAVPFFFKKYTSVMTATISK